uniref:Uncharacterized protein n=1 Tax=Arundo donax TaxID=35708 RepID=A0A0A9E2H1_ARUDO
MRQRAASASEARRSRCAGWWRGRREAMALRE